MIMTNNWWESIFSGPLAHGINEEKLHLLENEEFLFLRENEDHQDNHPLKN